MIPSLKIKSWEMKNGDMSVKCEMHQDGPNSFEVACYRLGQSIPVTYRFDTFQAASNYYSMFIENNEQEPEIANELKIENRMLRELCDSAQCWLDAAGHLATVHATKCALQRNADEFRRVYAKITS